MRSECPSATIQLKDLHQDLLVTDWAKPEETYHGVRHLPQNNHGENPYTDLQH